MFHVYIYIDAHYDDYYVICDAYITSDQIDNSQGNMQSGGSLRLATWNIARSLKELSDSQSNMLCKYDVVVLTEIGTRTADEFLLGEGVRTHHGIGCILREHFQWFVHPRP